MSRSLSALVLVTLITLIFSTASFAKRIAPPAIEPVVIGDVQFTAPIAQMGFIEARDAKTSRLLWSRQIYVVVITPGLERDVQDVFISKLSADGKNLLITNEAGSEFKLNTETLEVTTMKGSVKAQRG